MEKQVEGKKPWKATSDLGVRRALAEFMPFLHINSTLMQDLGCTSLLWMWFPHIILQLVLSHKEWDRQNTA